MTQKFTDFQKAWKFLQEHPIYVPDPDHKLIITKDEAKLWGESAGITFPGLHARPVFPNFGTLYIEISDSQPVIVELETGPWLRKEEWPEMERDEYSIRFPPGTATHDYELDSYGNTFEEAIISMANKVWDKYRTGKSFRSHLKEEIEKS